MPPAACRIPHREPAESDGPDTAEDLSFFFFGLHRHLFQIYRNESGTVYVLSCVPLNFGSCWFWTPVYEHDS